MSQSYDIGDAPDFRHYVRNGDGVLTAATVVFTFIAPDNTTQTPPVTTVSAGTYDCTLPALAQVGAWFLIVDVTGAITDRTTGQFYVDNPAAPHYAGLYTVKLAVLGVDGVADTTRDALFLGAIEAASRQVENTCGRVFYRDQAATARTYAVAGAQYYDRRERSYTLLIDDVATQTGLIVETGRGAGWQVIPATEYAVSPANALSKRRPITGLVRYRTWGVLDVRVTARWGYPTIPGEVTLASQLQSARLYSRNRSPEGVAGTAEWGAVRVARVDPDVAGLLADHVRHGVGS